MDATPKKVKFRWFIGGFVFGACVVLAVGWFVYSRQQSEMIKVTRQSDISPSTDYSFTDPLMTVTVTGDADSKAYAGVEKNIEEYIQTEKSAGVSSVAVNFRDINKSVSFNINPTELYDPASLTKIPLMMAYYNIAEQNPTILSNRITYSGKQDLDATEQIESPVQLVPGQSYSVESLIEHMIRNSDNNAEEMLADHLARIGQLGALSSVFDDIGISTSTTADNTTARSYSLFLRVLYNATYLDRNYSEKALQLLSQTDFSQGIDNGIPNNITVAEKFGDARIPDAQGNVIGVELQNCGIVYYPNHPYIICVMTKGSSIGDVEQAIGRISEMLFQEMEKRYPL